MIREESVSIAGRWVPGFGIGADSSSTLQSGQTLTSGQSVHSANGRGTLIMQPDGNLVLYDGQPQTDASGNLTGKALWASGTSGKPGATAIMQADGNLVVYAAGTSPNQAGTGSLWASGTSGHPGATVRFQNDGNLVVYKNASTTNPADSLWSSYTDGWTKAHPPKKSGFNLFDTSTYGQVTKPFEDVYNAAVPILAKASAALATAAPFLAAVPLIGPALTAGALALAAAGPALEKLREQGLSPAALAGAAQAALAAAPGGAGVTVSQITDVAPQLSDVVTHVRNIAAAATPSVQQIQQGQDLLHTVVKSTPALSAVATKSAPQVLLPLTASNTVSAEQVPKVIPSVLAKFASSDADSPIAALRRPVVLVATVLGVVAIGGGVYWVVTKKPARMGV
jgi:hypothetical protein